MVKKAKFEEGQEKREVSECQMARMTIAPQYSPNVPFGASLEGESRRIWTVNGRRKPGFSI